MRQKSPEHIGSIINKLFHSPEWRKQLEASEPLLVWREVVGPQIARQSQPESLKDGILQVRVENSVWLHHLRFLAETLRQKLNGKLASQEIKEIRFRQGPLESLPSKPPADRPKPQWRPQTSKKACAPFSPEQQRLLTTIRDPDLRAALRDLLRKQKHFPHT